MAYPIPGRRTVTIRANRDTIALVTGAVAMTFALSYAVHTRPAPVADTASAAPQQEWVGRLADVGADAKSNPPVETLTSASLVISPAALTLPAEPRAAPAKVRSCDASPCPSKIIATPLPPNRLKPAAPGATSPVEIVSLKSEPKGGTSGIGRFNPMNHIPDAVRRPFDYAGSTISGWIRRL